MSWLGWLWIIVDWSIEYFCSFFWHSFGSCCLKHISTSEKEKANNNIKQRNKPVH